MKQNQRKSNHDIRFEDEFLIYSINKEDKTASVYKWKLYMASIAIIPQSILYESNEYQITSILTNSFVFSPIKTLQFAENSRIQKIEKLSFVASTIESISIPSSLINLETECFMGCPNINKITIDPNNPRYSVYENKYIIGKSSIESNIGCPT